MEKLFPSYIDLGKRPSFYDEDSMTVIESEAEVRAKVNESVEAFNNLQIYTDSRLNYLLGEGLSLEVAKNILELVDNGTMEDLLNQEVLGEISNNIKGVQVNISQFPRLPGETTDYLRIKRAIEYILGNGGGRLFFPIGEYTSEETIVIGQIPSKINTPIPLIIEGEVSTSESHYNTGVIFKPITSKPFFHVNLDLNGRCTMNDFTRAWTGLTFKNFNVRGDVNYNSVFAKVFRCRIILENITCDNMYKLIEQPLRDTMNQQTYSDLWTIRNIRFRELRNIGIELKYADSTTIEGIYAEKSSNGCISILDIQSTESYSINGMLCSMNQYRTDTIENSYMIRASSSTGTISNFYTEFVNGFKNAIYIGTGNCTINNYSERYNGNNGILIFNSNVTINGYKCWTTRNAECYDITVIGGNTSRSKLVVNGINTTNYDGTGTPIVRDPIYNFADNTISALRTDLNIFRISYDTENSKFYARDKSGRDVKGLVGEPTMETDGMVMTFTGSHNSSLFRASTKTLTPIFSVGTMIMPVIGSIATTGFAKIYFIDMATGTRLEGSALTAQLARLDFYVNLG